VNVVNERYDPKSMDKKMKDEEFVKLKHWVDAEFTILHVMWAILLGAIVNKGIFWIGVAIYVLFSLLYAASRIQYVESKHMGYLKIPKR
jgi:hypothetical protein